MRVGVWKRCVLIQQSVRSSASRLQHSAAAEEERHCWLLETGPQLYGTHVPSSILQRAVLAAGSAVGALANPERDDLVSTFGETSGHYALEYVRSKMMKEEEGREILRLKPNIDTTTIDFDWLRKLPKESYGYKYTEFMDNRGFTPDARREVKYVDDPELAFIMQRYRQLHDFTHTLLGMPTSVYGEIVVKWFEAAQTGLPLCLLGGAVAPIRLPIRVQGELWSVYVPWAVQNGLQSRLLMSVFLERYFEKPLEDLRTSLHLQPPPQGSLSTDNH